MACSKLNVMLKAFDILFRDSMWETQQALSY